MTIEMPVMRIADTFIVIEPSLAFVAFRRLISDVPEAEAVLVRDLGWGYDIWTIVSHSTPETRAQLAARQWAFMEAYPSLDVDFHIIDRQGLPLREFVWPYEYDMFLKVRPGNGDSSSA